MIAKLALPNLLSLLLSQDAHLVENGLAACANFRISRRHFTFFGEAVELYLKHVSVKLLTVHVGLLLRHRSLLTLELLAHDALLYPTFIVTTV